MIPRETLSRIKEVFPDAVTEMPEQKEPTLLVKRRRLVEVATCLRDEQGMDYLGSVTGVDYPDYFEVVYYLYSMKQANGPLVLKVHLSREEPEVPSLTSVWQGADLQEREVWDLMGIRFSGHPHLKRILLWEGFPGHPLRKDFVSEWHIETDELVAEKYAA